VRFSLREFSEVFKLRNAAGRPYVLIGGQAVNYWAERYLKNEPELEGLLPFTSEDIDFKGGSDDVRWIARQLGAQPIFPPTVAMTALAGAVPFRIGDIRSNIEVVRRVPGVTGNLEETAVEAEWNGLSIRVMDPISLLASKLELVAKVPQENRRDALHVMILLPCVRGFLREFLGEVEAGHVPAAHLLGAVNHVLKLTTTRRARKFGEQHQVDWSAILPLAAINGCTHPKVRRFREQQLEKGYLDRAAQVPPRSREED
jgi:hypothetical protein